MDYVAFERVMAETCDHMPMRILAYCLMPNHWHLMLWPYEDGDMARYMHRMTTTHVHRWRQNRKSVGRGHLYQGTYKSFVVERETSLLVVCRYVERNARRAGLVERAEDWAWCSLWRRAHPHIVDGKPPLTAWPIDLPENWVEFVNEPQTEPELQAVRLALVKGRPFGSRSWQVRTARRLGLEATLRERGRPRKRGTEKKEPSSFF